MPELPEVETVRRNLSGLIIGKQISQVGTDWEKILNGGLQLFRDALIGQRFIAVDRRGKYLLLRLSGDNTIISHLRMEGKYALMEDHDEPHARFTHVWFTFTDGSELRYFDSRKFGRMTLVQTGTEMQTAGLATIGPEPTAADFSVTDFASKLARHKKAIKSVILDQATVAGVGNIYADETLWMSKIHPERPANSLQPEEVQALHDNIIAELSQAIDLGGTTVHSYVNALGKEGGFQNKLNVYGRTGEPCLRCGTPIEKIKVGGRGTHFCPHCQLAPSEG
ncbi:DNA-formamidopyrimidine glycosylase [Lacticaseibacillus sharpeae]|uniref:Formamidopyrimidine-DNA glycosylase n=1 Tax=Lacticaseibacillus sharpeae JCM 1186 = DSM 20505 TaxID=1291052 RepID=A0A0R1ZIW8_9LACO|nr:DNA-formamidopyrimidine glycosylase [Lacticaseibacillus sharpeae]KRM54904.1 formamidopyrimidine-DNA glycosylase [Lacticaseibacillus sharpeae JCM 1186 = DSM 20505]